jgi:hypothetical protein
MGPPLYGTSSDGFVYRQDRREALEKCRNELMRVRVQLAELKRTGSRDGLTSNADALSMRIRRFELY